jgi:hypothetical protein
VQQDGAIAATSERQLKPGSAPDVSDRAIVAG